MLSPQRRPSQGIPANTAMPLHQGAGSFENCSRQYSTVTVYLGLPGCSTSKRERVCIVTAVNPARQHCGWRLSPLCAKVYRQVLHISKAVSPMPHLLGPVKPRQIQRQLKSSRAGSSTECVDRSELLSPKLALRFVCGLKKSKPIHIKTFQCTTPLMAVL